MDDRIYTTARTKMIEEVSTKIETQDSRVLAALSRVPRHLFLDPRQRGLAYKCQSCAVPGMPGDVATLSDPSFVALMTDALQLSRDSVVLDVGTGTGYHAAINAELCRAVYGIEIWPNLAARADGVLKQLGYKNVHIRHGDGAHGWRKFAPYDAINVACAVPRVPDSLLEQLKIGGRMVIPVFKLGDQRRHELIQIIRLNEESYEFKVLREAVFVPMA